MNFGQKIALSLLLYMALGRVAFAQVVDIPDPNLRAAIHESLQRPEHLPINRAAMLHVVEIDARDRGITDLTGLEFATNLEYLELARNPISDLTPVANLTKLYRLFAWNCEIADISPLTNLTELRYLDLSYNRIADITALAGMTQLIELRLIDNEIGDVAPLADLTNLEHLELQYNRITDVTPLENLTDLEHLNIQNNPIFDPDSPLVDIPDPNLRAAIQGALNLPDNARITQTNIFQLVRLDVRGMEIRNLTGLEFATNLEYLELARNPISDLTPVANLTQLTHLFAWHCQISDVNPLANLTRLKYLDLRYNRIIDISALAGMTQLIELLLKANDIGDVSPLVNLTRLELLDITDNKVGDHSPLDGLSLRDLRYDETCELPPLPLQPRLDNRTYPSLFAAWGGPGWIRTLNRPELSDIENLASHDLWFSVPQFGLDLEETSHGFKIRGNLDEAVRRRDEFHAINPNMVFLVDIRMLEYWEHEAPEDWTGWVRDANGERVSYWPGAYLVDFTQPEVQDRIVEQVAAVSKCGLYDGIFFDHWHDRGSKLKGYVGLEAEQRARDIVIQRIRAETRPDFLVMGNTNVHPMPRTGALMNGSFMETPVPGDLGEDGAVYWLGRAEESLKWLEQNLREPRTNAVEGETIPTEPHDSPNNLRWMRAITTLSLTYSDGYVLFSKFPGHHHFWYDFWDADLGKPVGPKSQLYDENIPGLYIREYTNGWAVHNHSGEPQVVVLPKKVQGVASSGVGAEHVLSDLDGEIYLRIKPPNPADVNKDGVVNILDLTIIAQAFGTDSLEGDVNGDGVVNVIDLVFVANQF